MFLRYKYVQQKNKAFTIEENIRFGASVRLILKMLNLKRLSETWENVWVLFSLLLYERSYARC